MHPYHRYNHDFRRRVSVQRLWAVPFGTVAMILIVAVWNSPVLAQTGFGVQRLSNGQRSILPSLMQYPVTPANSLQPSEPPVVSAASKIESLFSRKEKESQPIASVVRLIAFEKSGQSFGSGSYIGNSNEYGLILSNWHVVKDGDGLVHIHFPNGFSSFGAVIDSDEKWDLATIVISKPPSSVEPISIARAVPVPGEPLWIAGHGPGDYRLAGGRCIRYLAPEMPTNGTSPAYEILELSVSARQGDSGGPILNRNGELAGVLFGSDMIRNTAGSYCGRVSQFLLRAKPTLDRLPAQPEVYFATIEKDGPKRQLRETVNFVPAEAVASVAAPSVVDIAGSSSSFGVRSNSRRYTQSASPAAVSVTDKTPSSPPSPPAGIPSVSPPPPSETFPATGSIQKAVWIPTGTSASLPPISFERMVVQTGLSTEIVATATKPRDPFAEDLSALNPRNGSSPSHRIVRENLRHSDYTKKYAAVSHSPYTLSSTPSDHRATFPSFFLFGVSFFTGLLVFQAIRLIRNDAVSDDDEGETTKISFECQQRQRAA